MADYPIDFVVLWVDGSDPRWLEEKNLWLSRTGRGTVDAADNRYRDWDNLRYWFRAVEAYAPWVRTVHFVTCGQRPEWLDPDAPGLHLVDHRDFIPEEYLPTFSSHPIELNLHRIPGLSEHFVYFNDDLFLTAPVTEEDFFVDGLPCDSLSEEPYEFDHSDVFNDVLINDMILINRRFDRLSARKQHPDKWYSPRCPHESAKNLLMSGLRNRKFFGLAYSHLPQSYRKAVLEELWQEEGAQLADTCSHRFRDARDVNQYVFLYSQLLSGQFYPKSRRKSCHVYSGRWDPEEAARAIETRRYRIVCINDSEVEDFPYARNRINRALAELLPEKSKYER